MSYHDSDVMAEEEEEEYEPDYDKQEEPNREYSHLGLEGEDLQSPDNEEMLHDDDDEDDQQESEPPSQQEEEQQEEEMGVDDESQGEIEELDIKSDDLEAIAILYDQIRSVNKQDDPETDKLLAEDFDKHLKVVMCELADQLKLDKPTHIKNANILKAKMSLFEICFTKAREHLLAGDDQLSNIFSKIQEGHGQIFNDYFYLVSSCPAAEEGSSQMQKKMNQNDKEMQEVIEAANNLNKQFESELAEKERLKEEFTHELAQAKKQIKTLEMENKKLLDTLIRHGKGEDLTKAGRENHPPGSAQAIFQGRRKFNKMGGTVGKTQQRVLTLKQLKDIINDIYSQKVKYDQKCEDSKLPRETMEQFMYTYLNQ